MTTDIENQNLLKILAETVGIGGSDDTTLENALAKSMNIFMNPNKRQIKWYAELTAQEVLFFSQLKVRNRFSKDRYTSQFIEDMLDFSISKERKGRTEVKEIFEKMALPRNISMTDRLKDVIERKH